MKTHSQAASNMEESSLGHGDGGAASRYVEPQLLGGGGLVKTAPNSQYSLKSQCLLSRKANTHLPRDASQP